MLAQALKQAAQALGFNLVGITPAEPSPTLAAYRQWIEKGMHADMTYMARPDRVERRENIQTIMPAARSVIMVGLDYRTVNFPELEDASRGRIAAYAWGQDYHDLMQARLEDLAQWLTRETAQDYKVYVDTGAVLERSYAQAAGLGFIGKNTMLIHPRRGSYFFIGEIISSIDFDTYDEAKRPTMCGTCSRCIQACPTDAFPKPYVLDARRCISYHTIENKGSIPLDLRANFGNWIFGCDICQDVCPFQRFSEASQEAAFFPVDADRAAPRLSDLLLLTEEDFQARYTGSPLERIKRRGLVRNACIATGNSQDKNLIPHLIQLLYDEEAVVRGHAAWGLWRLMRFQALGMLNAFYNRELDETVRAELEAFMP